MRLDRPAPGSLKGREEKRKGAGPPQGPTPTATVRWPAPKFHSFSEGTPVVESIVTRGPTPLVANRLRSGGKASTPAGQRKTARSRTGAAFFFGISRLFNRRPAARTRAYAACPG